MEPTWLIWLKGIGAVVAILMPLVIIPISKLIKKVRTNDLFHLDLKLDEHHKATMEKIDATNAAVSDVSKKLDRHIDWHMDNSRRQ